MKNILCILGIHLYKVTRTTKVEHPEFDYVNPRFITYKCERCGKTQQNFVADV